MFFALFLAAAVFLSAEEGVDTVLFPEINRNIIFVEGESAVSTNLALEPTLNYRASGSRTLQLNRSQGLQEGTPFFAEYAFYVSEGGTYRLWYAGTPPGPEQDLLPSYSSPVSVVIDGGAELPLYREDVFVRGQYLPTFYWVETGESMELTEGVHTIRFQVREKRRYDSQFYFYIDNFFFLREETAENPGRPLPEHFPESLEDDTDIEFKTIAEYTQAVAAAPEEPGPYLELADTYSLIGDYTNALKTLRKLRLLYPENPDYLILSAKNRLWKGDVQEGLRLYQQALAAAPQRKDIWNEAGKVAAWFGRYQESITFYSGGLEQHPEDPSLRVNLGITYLWKSEQELAEKQFLLAAQQAEESLKSRLLLGEIYRVNGYPSRAETIYQQGIKEYPLALELYAQLIEIYNSRGMTQKAEEVFSRIRDTIPETGRLSSYLDTFRKKQEMRDRVINEYKEKVAKSPDNIQLRQLLVDTFFWNGKRQEAIREYLHILTNYAYRAVTELERSSSDLLEMLDTASLYHTFFQRLGSELNGGLRNTGALVRELSAAEAKLSSLLEKEGSSEEELASAREVLAEKLQQTGEAVLYWQNLAGSASAYQYAYKAEADRLSGFKEQEEEDAERYEKIFEQNSWEWDRQFHINQLEKTLSTEPKLSGHVLGTVYKIEGKLQSAEQLYSLAMQQEEVLPATAAGMLEYSIWSGDWETVQQIFAERGEEVISYAPYFERLRSLYTELRKRDTGPGMVLSLEEVSRRWEQLNTDVQKLKPLISETAGAINSDIRTMREILNKRMVRTFYTLETDTYLLRYELGKYYIAEERYVEATEQLRKVLDIDPWNLDAQFRLGVVRQRYGDWKGAMRRYRTVYTQDSFYPNAASYYNLLARQHPDTFAVESRLLGDTSSISFTADITLSTAITTMLAWEGSYSFDGVRLYKTYGGEEPSSHQLHYAEIRLPLDLYFINLTLSPGAGVYFTSDLFRENALSTSEEILTMGYFLSLWSITPALSASVIFAPENLTLTGKYAWEPVEETFVPNRTVLRRHTISLSGYASLQGLDAPLFRYSSARAEGSLRFIEDGNVIGTAVEAFDFGIHLFDSPWTTLVISETVSFEHSAVPSSTTDNGYYAPDGVLLVKGGLSGSSWISLLNRNVLGIIAGIQAGGYWEKITAETPDPAALQLEGNGRLELSKGSTSYYLGVSGSQTFRPGAKETLYWSVQVSAGISARPTRLLAP